MSPQFSVAPAPKSGIAIMSCFGRGNFTLKKTFKEFQNFRTNISCIGCLIKRIGLSPDPEPHIVLTRRLNKSKLGHNKGDQVCRHLDRLLIVVPHIFCGSMHWHALVHYRHVTNAGHVPGTTKANLVPGLDTRLIKAWECSSGIRGLELGHSYVLLLP